MPRGHRSEFRSLKEMIEAEANPEILERLGIDARQQGVLDLARLCYQESVKKGDKIDEARNKANFCDLERLLGNIAMAFQEAEEGLALARKQAVVQGIDLENIGDGLEGDEERVKEAKRLWFAYAKVLNFKALVHRDVYDKSDLEARDFSALQQSTDTQKKVLFILKSIEHGFYKKVFFDLLKDKTESQNEGDWQEALAEAEANIPGSPFDLQFSLYAIKARCHDNLGVQEKGLECYREALRVAEKTTSPRSIAGSLVELSVALYRAGQNGEAASFFARIKIDDLQPEDFHHLKAYLLELSKHHPEVVERVGGEIK